MMIVIVSCGAKKRSYPCRAGLMYSGAYHLAQKRYALTLADPNHVYILSAKYGILGLYDKIKPYDMKLGDKKAVTPEIVKKQAADLGILNGEEVVVLGGAKYVTFCKKIWPGCKAPMENKGGMGEQIQAMMLKVHAAEKRERIKLLNRIRREKIKRLSKSLKGNN